MTETQKSPKIREDQEFGTGFGIHFIRDSFLGKGTYGTCVSAINKSTNQRVAVKIIEKRHLKHHIYEIIEREGSVLRQLNHPNIIKLLNYIDTNTHIYFVMELAEGGDLRKFITKRNQEGKPLKEAEVSLIMQKIFLAVQYIHSLGVVHRDLKLENILIQNPNDLNSIKICDFGLCGQGDIDNYEISKTFYTRCGTRTYMAPEMFTTSKYNEAVDLFSCGIVMYNLLLGNRDPYFDRDDDQTAFLEKLRTIEEHFPQEFSKMAKHLIVRLCKPKASERYTVKEALKHPWITRNFSDEVPLTAPEKIKQISQAHIFSRIIKAGIILAMWHNREEIIQKEKELEEPPKSTRESVIEKPEPKKLKREKLSLKNLSVEPGKFILSPHKRSAPIQLDIPKRDYNSYTINTETSIPQFEHKYKNSSVPPLPQINFETESSISPKKKIQLKKASMDVTEVESPSKASFEFFKAIQPIKIGNYYSGKKREDSEFKIKVSPTTNESRVKKIYLKKTENIDDKGSFADHSSTNESFSPPLSSASSNVKYTFDSPTKKHSSKLDLSKALKPMALEPDELKPRIVKSSSSPNKILKTPSIKSFAKNDKILPIINVHESASSNYLEPGTIGADYMVTPIKQLASNKYGTLPTQPSTSFNTLVSSSRSSFRNTNNNTVNTNKSTGLLIPFDVGSHIAETRKNMKFNQMIVSLSNFKVK